MTLLELAYNLSVLACKLTCVHACSDYTIHLSYPGIEVLIAASARLEELVVAVLAHPHRLEDCNSEAEARAHSTRAQRNERTTERERERERSN